MSTEEMLKKAQRHANKAEAAFTKGTDFGALEVEIALATMWSRMAQAQAQTEQRVLR